MNLHEYQAKELLKKYGVRVQEGFACSTPQEAEEAYRNIKTTYGSPFAVIKAQIHAGGRGTGTIKETGITGVKVAKSMDVAQDMYYEGPSDRREFYLSILLDRAKGQNVIMNSTEGGMDIEEVAHKTPERIFKEWVHPG